MIEVKVQDDTPELFGKLENAVSRFVRKSAIYTEGEVKSSINEPKSGHAYKRKGGAVHIASAPGESPANDSSNYVGSIQTIIANSLEAKVGTPLEYPIYLEEGTDTIEERPLWERIAQEILPTLETLLDSEIKGIR